MVEEWFEVCIHNSSDPFNGSFPVAMGCCVVSTKVLHHQAYVNFEVEEAGKEGIRFIGLDTSLVCPFGVWSLDSSEIIIKLCAALQSGDDGVEGGLQG